MIDFEKFENYILARKNKTSFVHSGTLISRDEFLKIQKLGKTYGASYMEMGISKSNDLKFIVECCCELCGTLYIKEISKTSFLEILRDCNYACSKIMKCENCLKKENEIENEKIKAQIELNYNNSLKHFEKFINSYLSPNRVWNKNIKSYEKYNILINEFVRIDNEKIADFIKQMSYADFLRTPYWKAIAEKKRIQAQYKCNLCNKNLELHCHHRTYDTHGYELHNLQDLIVLCSQCHKNFMNKICSTH